MALIFSRMLEVVMVHVHAVFYQVGLIAYAAVDLYELSWHSQKENGDDAENNTAVASAGSNEW